MRSKLNLGAFFVAEHPYQEKKQNMLKNILTLTEHLGALTRTNKRFLVLIQHRQLMQVPDIDLCFTTGHFAENSLAAVPFVL